MLELLVLLEEVLFCNLDLDMELLHLVLIEHLHGEEECAESLI